MTILTILYTSYLLGLTVAGQKIGIFEGSCDVGKVGYPGEARFDTIKKSYTVTGSGSNMWSNKDEFHFVWKKVSGNQSIEAATKFLGKGKSPFRKACLIIRQSLESDSSYAAIVVHGDGVTALQYRDVNGGMSQETQIPIRSPKSVKLSRKGDYVLADLNDTYSGASIRLELKEPFYIGLGVCSRDENSIETAVFSNVTIDPLELGPATYMSSLETVEISNTNRRISHVFEDHIEAPNWTPDGKHLIYNSQGLLYRMPWSGGTAEKINTDFATRCNNDHGISPDGKWIVISDQSQDENQSTIYVLPFSGGKPKRITKNAPSYWHGWSPDGKTLAYCAQRDGKFGIFTIPVDGGVETRLTTAEPGKLDDGPDFSPDGKQIYFNSDRSGKMQIYRMNTDGSKVEAVTKDDRNNWFPHVSPDGMWLVYLSYEADVTGHPANKDVMLRLLNLKDGSTKVLAKLFGGQGTINVPSWSPESKRLAFVSYQFVG
jgi:TolB protein